MGLPGCEACFVSLFTNIEYTKTKQGDHERPFPARWNYRNINHNTFPFRPVRLYIHWVLLDKLWQYAKTVKPRLSSLWQTSSLKKDCLKIKGFQLFFVIAAAKRRDLKQESPGIIRETFPSLTRGRRLLISGKAKLYLFDNTPNSQETTAISCEGDVDIFATSSNPDISVSGVIAPLHEPILTWVAVLSQHCVNKSTDSFLLRTKLWHIRKNCR